MMALSGVRSSWLMVARKSLFTRFISYSRMLAWANSSTLTSRLPLTLRNSCWIVVKWRNMRLKADGQSFELVAGVDLGPQGRVAAADLVADVAQVAQRLDDHVAHDDVRGEHRQKDGDDGRGDEDGPIFDQRAGIFAVAA